MRRIGVDFDNTIACYDVVFLKVTHDMGYLLDQLDLTKLQVKQCILELNEGELLWQKIQGQVYGKYMHQATIYPGFIEFLWLSKLHGDEIYIVSHKSEYGHFDQGKTNLRNAAQTWIKENLVKGTFGKAFSESNQIYFEPTREDKINRINEIECDIFIDDLQEVFDENNFPERTEKILFTPNRSIELPIANKQFDTWHNIKEYIYDETKTEEIKSILQYNFNLLDIAIIKRKKGRGNSRIYKFSDQYDKKYILKIYPDNRIDTRPRLMTDFYTSNMLNKASLPVPKGIAKNERLNWGIYEWVDGKLITDPDINFLTQSFQFISQLKNDDQLHYQFRDFPLASEACLSGKEIVSQIKKRFDRLVNVHDANLAEFLKQDFLPILQSVSMSAELKLGETFSIPLARKYQILNPSDFGLHNALLDNNNKYHFFDFEYFGWDDPVKLTSDFYWHPGTKLTKNLKIKWLMLTKKLFSEDPLYVKRLEAYLPLFGLRWCLIVLNKFLPEFFLGRVYVNKLENILDEQLRKSKTLLQNISELVTHGSTIEVS